jgi:hypothetical protein
VTKIAVIAWTGTLAVVLGAGGFALWTLFSSDEVNSKPEWSALQYLEANSRGVSPVGVVFKKAGEGYLAVGLPSKNGQSTVWILLNPAHAPLYKQMPATESPRLTQQMLTQIEAQRTVHPTVLAELRRMAVKGD